MHTNINRGKVKSGLLLRSLFQRLSTRHLAEIRKKGVFLRHFGVSEAIPFFNNQPRGSANVPHPRLLKYLKSAILQDASHRNSVLSIKHLKNLQRVSFYLSREQDNDFLLSLVNSLPKKIESLVLSLPQSGTLVDWVPAKKILKGLCPLANLESVFFFYQDKVLAGYQSVPDIFECLKTQMPRCRRLKNFSLKQSVYGQEAFRNVMRKGDVYPVVTDFTCCLDHQAFNNFQGLSWFWFYEICDKDGRCTSLDPGEDRRSPDVRQIMQNEIAPCLNFDAFPNLKSLTLQITFAYDLPPALVGTFQRMRQLQDLRVSFDLTKWRPAGTHLLFQAFLVLSELRLFSLKIPFLTSAEFELLERFFFKQPQLEALTFSITSRRHKKKLDRQQQTLLVSLLRSLSPLKNLRKLSLGLSFVCLSVISSGLALVHFKQLRSFKASGFHAAFHCCEPLDEPFSGLLEFFSRHTTSLTIVKISSPFFMCNSCECLKRIFEKLSSLSLEYLVLHINQDFSELRDDIMPHLWKQDGWNRWKVDQLTRDFQRFGYAEMMWSHLAWMVRLKKLVLVLGGLLECHGCLWFLRVLEVVTLLPKLQYFAFAFPFQELPEASLLRMAAILRRMPIKIQMDLNISTTESNFYAISDDSGGEQSPWFEDRQENPLLESIESAVGESGVGMEVKEPEKVIQEVNDDPFPLDEMFSREDVITLLSALIKSRNRKRSILL